MKKDYVKPELLVEEMLLESSILALSAGDITDKPVRPKSNERQNDRGAWGDLWN